MSFALDGLTAKIKSSKILLEVTENHSLVALANAIPWQTLYDLILSDLQQTTAKGFWNRGRKLYIRIHLAILILQALTKKTDRAIVYEIKDNAAYQVFCGATVINHWQCPHATKVEEFRSRLSPETKMKINEVIVGMAVDQGFSDPSIIDMDSTVQEANITYPTDAGMLLKLAKKCVQIALTLKSEIKIDLKKISALAKNYFFRGKCSQEVAQAALSRYFQFVKSQVMPVIACAEERVKNNKLTVR